MKTFRSRTSRVVPARRPDIQGLRAIAVVAVVVEHVSGWPAGGFVGVDVFFVISGFIITGLLLREQARTGRISMTGFYRRRVARLAPALLLVIGTTLLTMLAVLPPARTAAATVDAAWALGFLANRHFAAIGTDYFASDGPESPFQHLWSLSVEEQFYVVWPVLIIVLLGIRRPEPGSARADRSGRLLLVVLLAVVVASFAWSLHASLASPTDAYFSTVARAWELGAGAVVALTLRWWSRVPRWLGWSIAMLGLLIIVASLFVIDSTTPFPGPGAALPVIGTVLVLIGGSAPNAVRNPILTNPVARVVGDLSYGLYLWHFPVFVVVGTLAPDAVWVAYPITAALTVVSYHLVEQPMLNAPCFVPPSRSSSRSSSRTPSHAPGSRSDRRRERWRVWWHDHRDRMARAAVGGLAVVAVVLVMVAADRDGPRPGPGIQAIPTSAPEDAATVDADTATADGPEVAAMKTAVRDALAEVTWPELDPAVGPEMPGGKHLACGEVTKLPPQRECTFGPASATRTAVLVGDSTAMHELQALASIASAPGSDWRVVNRAAFACSFIDVRIGVGDVEACTAYRAATVDMIAKEKPDLVIVTNTFEPLALDGAGRDMTLAEWGRGLTATMDAIRPNVGAVLHVTPPPAGKNIQQCYRPNGSPSDCVSATGSSWSEHMSVVRRLLADGVSVLDMRDLVCGANACPAFVGNTPVRKDFVHFTAAFQQRMTPALHELLAGAGYFTTAEFPGTPG